MVGLAALVTGLVAASTGPAVAAPGDYTRATLSGQPGEVLVGDIYLTFDAVTASLSGETLTATLGAGGPSPWTLTVQPPPGGTLAEGQQLSVRKNPTTAPDGTTFAGLNLTGAGRECSEVYALYNIRRLERTDLSFGLDFNLRCHQSDAPVLSGFVAYRLARGPLDETRLSTGDMVPVDPTRLLDTRGSGGPIGPNAQRDLDVTTGPVPAGALSVVLNVTAVLPTQPGYLTVYPAGATRPTASNLNFVPGQIVPNLVTVQVGEGGDVTIYNYQGDTHVVVDVVGYYAPSAEAGGARFRGVVPVRLLDTRDVGGPFRPHEVRELPVGTGPATTGAILNVTVDRTVGAGYVTVYPADLASPPLASNLNFATGETVPNLVMVRLSPDKKVKLTTNGHTDLIVDLVGTFVADEADAKGRFVSIAPDRLVDTRTAPGGGAIGEGQLRDFGLTGLLGLYPSEASGVVFNATVAETTGDSFLTLWPAGQVRPNASNLNWRAGDVRPNLVAMGTGVDGFVSAYNLRGQAQLIIDAAGWFTG